MGTTPNFGWTYPTVGGSTDTWGATLNAMAIAMDASLFNYAPSVTGSINNAIIGANAPKAGIFTTLSATLSATLGPTVAQPFTGGDLPCASTIVVSGAAGAIAGLGIAAYGPNGGHAIHTYRALGTYLAPTSPTVGTELWSVGTRGYCSDVGSFGFSSGAFIYTCSETHSSTSQGTYATIETTPTGSPASARVPALIWTPNGDSVSGTRLASDVSASGLDFGIAGYIWGMYGPANTNAFFAKTNGGIGMLIDRETSDGEVCEFRRGHGTTVGGISVTAAATAFNTTSDERLKIRDYGEAPHILDDVSPHSFRWKKDGKRAFGFFAQELHIHYPDAVTVGGDNPNLEPWSVDNSKLVPILWAEIQALRKRVAALETR